MNTRKCIRCKYELPRTNTYFAKDKSYKDGLSGVCKQCMKEYNIKRYINQKDKLKVQTRTYYENNKDHYKELFEKNSREYYQAHKERYKENHDKYREGHKEYYSEYHKIYAQENRDKLRIIYNRRYNKIRSLPTTLTVEQWEYIKAIFNNNCCYCGKSEEEHIKELGTSLEQEHFIAVTNNGGYTIDNIIPSCKSCNCSKGNKDFFDWYPTYKFYDKDREIFILEHLEYIEDEWESFEEDII